MGQLRASRRQSNPGFRNAALARALKRAVSGAVMAAPVLLASQAAHAQAEGRNYAIPAGTLEEVLGRFGRESGIMLSFRPEVAAGQMSNGLQGRYTVQGGLDALLVNTGINAQRQGNGSYLLTSPPPAAGAAATGAAAGT